MAATTEIRAEVRHCYGSPRMAAELNRRGFDGSENFVAAQDRGHVLRRAHRRPSMDLGGKRLGAGRSPGRCRETSTRLAGVAAHRARPVSASKSAPVELSSPGHSVIRLGGPGGGRCRVCTSLGAPHGRPHPVRRTGHRSRPAQPARPAAPAVRHPGHGRPGHADGPHPPGRHRPLRTRSHARPGRRPRLHPRENAVPVHPLPHPRRPRRGRRRSGPGTARRPAGGGEGGRRRRDVLPAGCGRESRRRGGRLPTGRDG